MCSRIACDILLAKKGETMKTLDNIDYDKELGSIYGVDDEQDNGAETDDFNVIEDAIGINYGSEMLPND